MQQNLRTGSWPLWRAEDLTPVAFYGYTTYAMDVDKISIEYDPAYGPESEWCNKTVRKCFNGLMKEVKKRMSIDPFIDGNKIAIEAVSKIDGKTYFIGFYDWRWYVATAVQGDNRKITL